MKNKFRFYKKVLNYVRPFWGVLAVSSLLAIIPSALGSLNHYFSGKIVDGLYENNMASIKFFIISFTVLVLVKALVGRVRGMWEIRKVNFSLGNYVTRNSLERSFRLSLGQLRQEHSGFKQNVLQSGSTAIENLNQMIIVESIPLFTTIITSIVGLFLVHKPFAYIAAAFFFAYYIFGKIVNRWISSLMRDLIKKRIETNKTFLDILKNLFLLKFSGQMKSTGAHLKMAQTKMEEIGIKMWTEYNMKHIVSDVLIVVYFACSVVYATYLISSGVLSIGMFVPIMAWVYAVQSSISEFRMYQRRIMIAESDIEKMFEMFEQKSDIVIDPNARAIKTFDKSIAFENVSFDYQEGKKNALVDINFEIKKGEKVALVGRSGSGKTTIMSLLLRLYDPNSGAIMIDGVDLRSLELSDWHNMIGYVSQDGDIMDISIRENILFGALHAATDSEIDFVLEKAGIKEFIHHLPQGIDTKVGENGVKLSGGQRQRVCIARALIKNAPILMLDEATSSLDSETESIVNKAVWEMLGDKTGVVIAHRLSTILDADKIIAMDHGKIVGIGTHEELLKTTPYYKLLVDAQNISL